VHHRVVVLSHRGRRREHHRCIRRHFLRNTKRVYWGKINGKNILSCSNWFLLWIQIRARRKAIYHTSLVSSSRCERVFSSRSWVWDKREFAFKALFAKSRGSIYSLFLSEDPPATKALS
jgi:hypothetical protein